MRREVRNEKGEDVKDSQAQGEDTQQAEFESESNQEDSNPNRNSEHRESSEVGGFD